MFRNISITEGKTLERSHKMAKKSNFLNENSLVDRKWKSYLILQTRQINGHLLEGAEMEKVV